ncbi:hypothetical protein CERSUDRAFT_115281 [Gelatoporia subvermispora B]|uniref:Uncharacterized protein n=1 Tax=Ceriporiopsis subvermispora (strain B) TaxID=914234 RepID=M2RD29_CERS8|nr:hypothetical protein CERSUDRAFT_115281 [Gelatoporia subvermispora B]
MEALCLERREGAVVMADRRTHAVAASCFQSGAFMRGTLSPTGCQGCIVLSSALLVLFSLLQFSSSTRISDTHPLQTIHHENIEAQVWARSMTRAAPFRSL